MSWTWGTFAGVALCVPALIGWDGHWPFGLGLWLGEAMGAGSFFWIHHTVHSALDPGNVAKNPWGLLGHSVLRLGALGLVFFLVLKTPALSIWAVLLGYLLVQLPATLWQRGVFQGRKRGLNP